MRLRTVNTKQWVTVEKGENKAEFLVEPLTPRDTLKLIDECQIVTWKKGQRSSEPDLYKLKIKRICKVIKEWKGIEDEDGNPVPCTDENKELIYNCNSDIIDEVLEKAEEISGYRDEQTQEQLKNSQSGQHGSPKTEQ